MKANKDVLKKIKELEEEIRYNEAMLEEVYETQEALFPIFADLVKLISKIYEEMHIQDSEFKKRITRLMETFVDREDIMEKYNSDNEKIESESGMAYT